MAEFINPAPGLSDLHHVFEEAHRSGAGILIDAELSGHMASVLSEAADGVLVLVEFARSFGLVHGLDPVQTRRTPTERQHLARLVQPLDPERRVVALPVPSSRRMTMSEGRSAA